MNNIAENENPFHEGAFIFDNFKINSVNECIKYVALTIYIFCLSAMFIIVYFQFPTLDYG